MGRLTGISLLKLLYTSRPHTTVCLASSYEVLYYYIYTEYRPVRLDKEQRATNYCTSSVQILLHI